MNLKNLFTVLILASAFLISSCGGQGQKAENQAESEAEAAPQEEHAHLHYIQLAVEGMTCEGCENTVKGAIEKVEGVHSASATHLEAYAIAGYNTVEPDTTALKEAITTAGYKVTNIRFIGHDLPKKE